MNDPAIFVDTWGWLALGHRQESRHEQVKAIYQDLGRRQISIYTSDYVLDELITLLFRREIFEKATRFVEGILTAATLGQVTVERVTPERFVAAWTLRKRFQDKPTISFTDLSSMVIMDERNIHRVLTEDDHFIQVGMGFSRLP